MIKPSLVALVGLLALSGVAARSSAGLDGNAPLPHDERDVVGQFDNGMHYIIRHNANPPGRVSTYLHVKTGALNETDEQNGLAHFLEHMAFNGSAHFKPGELVPLLQSLGMRFGADTNAHTNLWETVYKLNLPDNDPQRIDLAMKIFADYADGLTLAPDEIESERKVILEEGRARKSAAERIQKRMMGDVFADTRLAVHDVMGDEAQIHTFPQAEFQKYWNDWYRPENMTVIIVGDVKPEEVVATAKKWLADIKPRSAARQSMKAGVKPTVSPRAFVFSDPEQVATGIELSRMTSARPKIRTVADYRRQLLDGVATSIVDRRFRNRVAAGDAPFRAADTDVDDFLGEATVVSAQANGEAQDWNKILDAVILELNRAIEHGFTDEEFELVKRSLLESADQAVRTDDSADSTGVITAIASAIGLEQPILSATQQRDLLQDALATMTVGELQKAFVEAYRSNAYNYVVILPPAKDGASLPTTDDVLAAAAAAWAKRTDPPTTSTSNTALLATEPDAGAVVSQETDAELKLTTVTFANGVVMHHMFNDYKKDQVIVRLTMPGGQIEEDAQTRGITEMAALAISQPATDRFTSTQIRDFLSGKSVGFGGGVGFDSVLLSIAGSPKDLPVGMQLAYGVLSSGKIEASAVANWKRAQVQAINQAKLQPAGQLQQAMADTFYGGDARLKPLTVEDVNRLTIEQAQAWFDRIARDAPIEVTVVGDMPLEQATKLIGRYVGSLPKRTNDFHALDKRRTLARKDGPFEARVEFPSVTPQAVAVAGFVSCDALDPDRRPLSLAAIILTDRMITRIREHEQLVYSIGARNDPGRSLPGTGIFSASSTTDPKNADRLADVVLEMMADFAKSGPTDDELATAKRQMATELGTSMREPSWWLAQISELAYRGRSLDDIKALPGVFDRFTADEVRTTFAKYFKQQSTIRYLAIPHQAEAATKPSATTVATEPALVH